MSCIFNNFWAELNCLLTPSRFSFIRKKKNYRQKREYFVLANKSEFRNTETRSNVAELIFKIYKKKKKSQILFFI